MELGTLALFCTNALMRAAVIARSMERIPLSRHKPGLAKPPVVHYDLVHGNLDYANLIP